MKYPGAFILNEYGTNKELSKIYGVSERTIYRWKNKAKAETGARVRKPTRPRVSTLQKFKGTRKELAKKYGVSERTAYRWIAQAKAKGVEIESRQKKPKYPGADILLEDKTNKQLAEKYNVSERTVARWKRRARNETSLDEPFEVLPPDETFEPPIEEKPFEEPEQEFFEDEDFFRDNFGDEETESKDPLEDIYNMLNEFELINNNSLFHDLPPETQKRYLLDYIIFQHDENPWKWYDVFGDNLLHLDDPVGISMINIWDDEFENWVKNQIEIDKTFV